MIKNGENLFNNIYTKFEIGANPSLVGIGKTQVSSWFPKRADCILSKFRLIRPS